MYLLKYFKIVKDTDNVLDFVEEEIKYVGAYEAQRILPTCLKGHMASEYRARNWTLLYGISSNVQGMLAMAP